MRKNHWQELFAIVKIRKVLVFLNQDLIVEDYLDFLEWFSDVKSLLLAETPGADKGDAIA